MAVDPRILAKFQQEFDDSKNRAAEYQTRIDGLNADLDQLNANLSGESGIQDAINAALTQLGEAPLS